MRVDISLYTGEFVDLSNRPLAREIPFQCESMIENGNRRCTADAKFSRESSHRRAYFVCWRHALGCFKEPQHG